MLRAALVPFLAATLLSPTCGGSSSTSPPIENLTNNVQLISVDPGPVDEYFDGAFTSVTVCVPGSSTCQTISGILVDTGSSGLRILSSALTIPLPQQTASNGASIVECNQFEDGYTWGPLQTADVAMSGEQARSVPIQVIDSAGNIAVPSSCSSAGPISEDTLDSLGANGVLGIGLFRQDCGEACAISGASNPGLYYTCSTSAICQTTAESLTAQVQNPVWLFPQDNNGVVIQLPAVPAAGQSTAGGSLIFGIGTQTDNALGSAKVITPDADGNMTTTFGAQTYTSFIDSGSNAFFFLDSLTTGLPLCPDASFFYCPAAPQTLAATIRGVNGVTTPISFSITNADTFLNNQQLDASSTIGGPNSGMFDWGLPFFFGRTVFTAIESQTTPGGVGPYWAY